MERPTNIVTLSTKKGWKYQHNSFSILTAFLCLVIIGVACLPFLSLQLNPSRALPSLQVSYYWPEASARVIETEVTSRLEGLFSTVRGISSVSSVSSSGRGYISLEFKKNVNIDAIRFEIASLLRQAYQDLPPQVSYPYLSLNASGQREAPVLTYTLNSASSSHFIQQYAEENIVPKLSTIKGLREVGVYGSTPYHWELTYNPEQISVLGISSNEIASSINAYIKSSALGTGLFMSTEGERELDVILTQASGDSTLLGTIPIKSVNNRIIYLKDIADIRFAEKDVNAYFRVNGLNTVNLVLYPEKGVNNLRLAKALQEAVNGLKEDLPPGYSILLAHDESEFIRKELKTISYRFFFSFAILLVFVLVVSRQLKYLLLIIASMVVNLMIAVAFYYFFKVEIHLYSLAGITISMGLIIDNCIVIVDHLRYKGDKKVLLAIIAATMTTVAALSIIFLLQEEQRVNLIDFALVITINLAVSVIVAMYFIPALMEKITLKQRKGKIYIRRKKRVIRFTGAYARYIRFGKRFRWAFILIALLGFGIPVQWLPGKIEKEGFWSDVYNQTLASQWFTENPKPYMEKILGGGLRLFTAFVFENAFYAEPERTTLHVRGSMPEGGTVEQLNQAITKMENFISKFKEVELFKTSVTSYRDSDIAIYFKEEHERSSFPHNLKSQLESQAINLGGLDWSVYGVGRGFSNALHSGWRNSRIHLQGYNYEQLNNYAELLRKDLLENPRIKEVDITGPDYWTQTSRHEYYLDFYPEKLAVYNINQWQIFDFVKERTTQLPLGSWFYNGNYNEMVLRPDRYRKYDIWNLMNSSLNFNDHSYKFSELGVLKKRKSGNDIYKNNQQYQVFVVYDFIGPDALSQKVREEKIKAMNEIFPLGFTAEDQRWYGWDKEEKSQYYLILLVLLVIFIICSVLFNSLRQPFAILFLVPISFIGIFLTFYLFDINFDQGGFASFIMVAGLVVNAGIYVINDYNNFKKDNPSKKLSKLYLKAFNHKLIPIMLTTLSTVLGLVPFIWGGQHEVFWYAFAAGSIGGLVFSLVAVVFYLPLFINTPQIK